MFPDLTVEQARAKAEELNNKLAVWKAANYETEKFTQRSGLTLDDLAEEYIGQAPARARQESRVCREAPPLGAGPPLRAPPATQAEPDPLRGRRGAAPEDRRDPPPHGQRRRQAAAHAVQLRHQETAPSRRDPRGTSSSTKRTPARAFYSLPSWSGSGPRWPSRRTGTSSTLPIWHCGPVRDAATCFRCAGPIFRWKTIAG